MLSPGGRAESVGQLIPTGPMYSRREEFSRTEFRYHYTTILLCRYVVNTGLPPPQTEGNGASQPSRSHSPRQLSPSLRQGFLPPPQVVLPSRRIQGFRLRRQGQVEASEHGDLQLPPAHRCPGLVNPTSRRPSSNPQLPPLGHQRSGRAEGVFLIGLRLHRDHPNIG